MEVKIGKLIYYITRSFRKAYTSFETIYLKNSLENVVSEAFSSIYSETDWLEVHDGQNNHSPMIGGKLCGNDIPTTIFSTGNEMLIEYHKGSNNSNESGIKLKVESIGITKAIVELIR